jgi:hypothetical protein
MSNFNNGRYKDNIGWISQLMFNDGVKGLEDWLETVDQDFKDDIVLMIDQLSNRLKHGVCKSAASGYEYSEEVNAEAIAQIPHLRLVK